MIAGLSTKPDLNNMLATAKGPTDDGDRFVVNTADGKTVSLPDDSHFKQNVPQWNDTLKQYGFNIGKYSFCDTLMLSDLQSMEAHVLAFGRHATGVDEVTLSVGGFIFEKGAVWFQYRLEVSPTNAFHFHGEIDGRTVKTVGWRRYFKPKKEVPCQDMSVRMFTALSVENGANRNTHVLRMFT